jgi:HAD superfamily hydrolase (TIGR01459 family)
MKLLILYLVDWWQKRVLIFKLGNLGKLMVVRDFSCIPQTFKGVLLDAYGVFWGGNAFGVLAGAAEMMKQLVSTGKVVGILSNTTQMSEKEIRKLAANGLVQGLHYHFYITSGDISKSVFSQQDLPFATPNKRFFLAGGSDHHIPNHRAIFDGTGFEETHVIEEADFIYLNVPRIQGEDQTNPEKFRAELVHLRHFNLPLVCANPDRFAQEGNPPRPVVRQGSLAVMYEELGGSVFYIGKPHTKSFEMAMRSFEQYGVYKTNDVIMVGDTPETDIRGGRNFGMKTALVIQTGMMAQREDLHSLPTADRPDYYIERLGSNGL